MILEGAILNSMALEPSGGESGGGATRLMSGDVIVIPQRKLFE